MQTAKNLKGLFNFIKQRIIRTLFFMSFGLVCLGVSAQADVALARKIESAFQSDSGDCMHALRAYLVSP